SASFQLPMIARLRRNSLLFFIYRETLAFSLLLVDLLLPTCSLRPLTPTSSAAGRCRQPLPFARPAGSTLPLADVGVPRSVVDARLGLVADLPALSIPLRPLRRASLEAVGASALFFTWRW
ncbi:hypothetical protein P4123_02145, partial [Pseudomonas aeruginosa]|nr:hypothetical protein [Pseudomonas aeruginosa]